MHSPIIPQQMFVASLPLLECCLISFLASTYTVRTSSKLKIVKTEKYRNTCMISQEATGNWPYILSVCGCADWDGHMWLYTQVSTFFSFLPLLPDSYQTRTEKLLSYFNCQESCLFLCGNQATRLLSWESTTAAKKPFKNSLFFLFPG